MLPPFLGWRKKQHCSSACGGPGAVVNAACLESREIMAFKFQRNMFLPRSLVKIQYCGEPPWPRGRVLGLRLQGLGFRIRSLESNVISYISPSSEGYPGQRWPKTTKTLLLIHSFLSLRVNIDIYYLLCDKIEAARIIYYVIMPT